MRVQLLAHHFCPAPPPAFFGLSSSSRLLAFTVYLARHGATALVMSALSTVVADDDGAGIQ